MPISLTTPVKDYDDTLIGELIRFVENPDSVGFENGRWYSPKYHPEYNPNKPQWDKYNFGMGIDRNTNEFVKNGELTFHKDDRGREYLTEEEERNARNHSIANAEASYNNRLAYAQKVVGTNKVPSEMKKALTINAIYNLGQGTVSSDLFSNRKLMTAFLNGTEQEYSDIINKYYDKYDKANRGPQTNIFLTNYLSGNVGQPTSIVEPVLDFSEKRDAIQPLNPYPKKIENIVVEEHGPYKDNYGVTSSEKRAAQIRAAVKAKHDYEKIMKATNLKSTATEFKPKFAFDTGGFLQPKDAWDALSMEAKAEMMKVAINHGIYNLDDIRKKYNEFAEGGSKEDLPAVEPYEQREEVVITPDTEYNMYLNTLPDNQRFTPNDRYDSYLYWKLNDRPKNFLEAVRKRMFTYDHSDNGYHANSIAFDDNTGIGYFMKPKDHDTVGYELDWFNKGLVTEEGGKQRPVTPEEAVELNEFRRNYTLTDDPDRPNFFMYQPIERANGGGIHIAPSKRGTFTAAASKHGKSVQAFASQVLAHKENYSPAMVKKANFARNAKKFKHGEGGNLFDGTSQPTQKMQIGLDVQGWPDYTTEQIVAYGEENERRRKAIQDAYLNFVTESNDATAIAGGRSQNQHLVDKAIRGAKANAAWEQDNPELALAGNSAAIIPLAVASLPAVIPAGEALAETALGHLATKALTHPITEALGTSMAGGHGLSDLLSGNANTFTALELAPLAFPYGNFAGGTREALNYIGSKIPAPIKQAWDNRAEKAAMFLGKEGETWAKVTDQQGKEGIVFLDGNDTMKGIADWMLHPMQTYRERINGFYPMTRTEWKTYLKRERDAMDFAKQKSIELNDTQLQQRLSLQPETFLDNKQRNANATIKIVDDPNNVFSWPRAPRNASEVANNVKIISRDKDVSYGGKWFDPKFGTGTAAVSHPDKNVIVLPRHDQTKFSNRFYTMPTRGYTSPIDTRMHTYVHELQHQMQQNLPLLNLSQWDDATQYYIPYDHFLRNIDSENVLQPFKDTSKKYPNRYWYASPNEFNAESNAYRVVDDYNGRRNILDPLDSRNAYRANIFGLNYDQTGSLWYMGYKNGGNLKR